MLKTSKQSMGGGGSHQAQYGIYTLSFNWSKNCKFIAILTKREDGRVFTHGGGGGGGLK